MGPGPILNFGLFAYRFACDPPRAMGAYDELVRAELTAYLGGHPHAFNAIILADVLIYFESF